uniref:Zinc finger transcription factor n=1 Tax=Volvariella volvacea TaxID=36659 RepID=A0A0K1IK10_9AGAR|nr:zinc finger transcription factor [Volvariella volvacea]
MNPSDQRTRQHEDDDRSAAAGAAGLYSTKPHLGPSHDIPGKTSFLRLLLDTCDISPNATREQLASVAKFVQGCSGHTSYIRVASIDVNVGSGGTGPHRSLGLTLIDTPSLDFNDPEGSERLLSDTMRHIDGRFAEGLEDDWRNHTGDKYVHLCIYFLDPDRIVPPPVPAPPAPLVPRARAGSFSQPDQEPVILEPPVTTNPLLFKPMLPAAEINTIRRLSARVNVLPVIARADSLSNDRLAAVKLAVRRNLADAGIGFGIFDVDNYRHGQDDLPTPKSTDHANGYGAHPNGSPSTNITPPTSPVTASLLRLPYGLISPDIYSHSDGVPRIPLSRHDLVQQYTPVPHHSPSPSKIVRGKYIRSYRWGSMDVLDPNHCDFMPLRSAIFHHMETLQKYTREYLFDKFRAEYQQTRPSSRHPLPHRGPQGLTPMGTSLSHGSRPPLVIDTTHPALNRHPPLPPPRDFLGGSEIHSPSISRPLADPTSLSSRGSSAPRSAKQRPKKITVACNFCRSRKLKCDGGRPACGQCLKRSNPCDYMPQNKRRGGMKQRKGDDSDSDSGGGSGEPNDASLSPRVPSQSLARRDPTLEQPAHDNFVPPLPPLGRLSERQEEVPPIPSSSRSKPNHASSEASRFFPDNELPHIATLSLPDPSPTTPVPVSAPTLPPIRPASEQQAQQRRRSATVPGKSTRQGSTSGPKVVACNFCRARKTKCDGAHPACASCARRQLPCNYVHDPGASNGSNQKKSRRASTSKVPAEPPHTPSPPSSRFVSTTTPGNEAQDPREIDGHLEGDIDLKRSSEHPDTSRPPKKMRMESPPAIAGIP